MTSIGQGFDLTPHRLRAGRAPVGVLGTGVAHLLNYRSIAEVGPTRASVVTQLVPVVAVTVGVVFLREPFHLRLVFGAALTLFGIALAARADQAVPDGAGRHLSSIHAVNGRPGSTTVARPRLGASGGPVCGSTHTADAGAV